MWIVKDNIKEAEGSVAFSFSVTYSISKKNIFTVNISLAAIISMTHWEFENVNIAIPETSDSVMRQHKTEVTWI